MNMVNVDGVMFHSDINDNFSSLISLSYSASEQPNLSIILAGFVSRNKETILRIITEIDSNEELTGLKEVSERIEMLFLLERLHTNPKLVLNIFRLSNFEKMVACLEAKRWV